MAIKTLMSTGLRRAISAKKYRAAPYERPRVGVFGLLCPPGFAIFLERGFARATDSSFGFSGFGIRMYGSLLGR